MWDSIKVLFNTDDFPARWNCGNWSNAHGIVHITADIAIAIAYFLIPLALAGYWWVKRNELAFSKIIWLFVGFIFSCGSVHLIEAVIFYHPIYRVAGLLKVTTAIVSWATLIGIIRIAPNALELPGLRRANAELAEQLEITKKTSEALLQSNQDLKQFSEVLTHDLRNPLCSTLFIAELAKESAEAGEPEVMLNRIETVLSSLRQMDQLVQELHTQALANRRFNEVLGPVSLENILKAVTENMAPQIKVAGATLEMGELPMVEGNRILLTQLFTNLLDNAIKYRSSEPLVIRIEARAEAFSEIVVISDNGRGVPEGEEEKIFDLEGRASNVVGVLGSGIGLSLARRIMTGHGGTIKALPRNGQGAAFQLTFPRLEKTDVGSAEVPAGRIP